MSRIFSGVQPTGELHIGNLLGAVQNWVSLQDRYECFFAIVDLHAITATFYEPELHRQRTREMATGLLAAGVDPAKVTLFVQSHVPAHAELMWLLNAVAPLGELERMTQFKDKSAGLESVPAGLLNYPILMAADILLYRADLVPVGDDQVQHLELARELARRWNAAYGGGAEPLPEPKPLLTKATRIIGLDGESKMSKSRGNSIGILDSPDDIWSKLRPAKTDPARKRLQDPGNPDICNMYDYHKHFSPPETVTTVAANCRGAAWGCLDCKRVLADNMIATLTPIRDRAVELTAAPDRVDAVLRDGAAAASAAAAETMNLVYDRMGFLPSDG